MASEDLPELWAFRDVSLVVSDEGEGEEGREEGEEDPFLLLCEATIRHTLDNNSSQGRSVVLGDFLQELR
eukprot:evm.model.NODE_47826_length_1642_cov_24.347746.1